LILNFEIKIFHQRQQYILIGAGEAKNIQIVKEQKS
jgi:hypothetical protein